MKGGVWEGRCEGWCGREGVKVVWEGRCEGGVGEKV